MRVIGHIRSTKYLVEIDEDEIARAAGYSSYVDPAWRRERPAGEGGLLEVGTKIDADAAFTFHARIKEREEMVTQAAASLRALATMIEREVPTVVFRLKEPASEAKGGES